MSKENPRKVDRVGRSVIEHKLLDSLESGKHVAILASKQDLDDLLFALTNCIAAMDRRERCLDLAAGLRQLKKEAFP